MNVESLQIEVPNSEPGADHITDNAPRIWERKYQNSTNDLVLGFDPYSEEAVSKKSIRAKRFGIKKGAIEGEEKNPFLSISLKNLRWPPLSDKPSTEIRPDALLIYGVQDMSTKDVFDYFKLYGPDTIEWVDDFSCNVVWEFASSAALALKACSKTYEELYLLQKEHGTVDEDINLSVDNERASHEWRISLPCSTGHQIFLRQSLRGDRKLPGAAGRSFYYLKYGRDGLQKGIVSSSRKRKLEQLERTAKERMNPSEPDVKFMDIDLDVPRSVEPVEDMEVDRDYQGPAAKRSRPLGVHNMYSDQTETTNDSVFGRLGQQDRPQQDKRSSPERERKKPMRERLGPVNEMTKLPIKEHRAPICTTEGSGQLDLRSKLKAKKETSEDRNKLLNLCIEITEVKKEREKGIEREKDREREKEREKERERRSERERLEVQNRIREKKADASRTWKRDEPTDTIVAEGTSSQSSESDSSSDSDSDSDSDANDEGRKSLKDDEESDSSSSSSSSSSDGDGDESDDEDEDDDGSESDKEESHSQDRRDNYVKKASRGRERERERNTSSSYSD